MSLEAKRWITPEEYLAAERAAQWKSEYYNGRVFAMAGASRKHNRISVNVATLLDTALADRSFELFAWQMRMKVSETGLYTYPDVIVVHGEPQFEDDKFDILLNPTVIVEVLSSSTAEYDRGDKFDHYRELPSLREYVLIAQDRSRVERYVRHGEDEWLLTVSRDPAGTIHLAAIDCDLPLARVYRRVTFETTEGDAERPAAPPSG